MISMTRGTTIAVATVLMLETASLANAQTVSGSRVPPGPSPFSNTQMVVPQVRGFAFDGGSAAEITTVAADVSVVNQVATTALDIHLRNPGGRRIEAELIVPVPDGAVVRGFAFRGNAGEPTARILPREEARRVYDEIVMRTRDPAMLEFAGYNLVRSSVFPVEANGEQTLRLTYEVLLPAEGDRVDYLLPRSESLQYGVPWTVSMTIRSKRPISTAYSPSHQIETDRRGPGELIVRTVGGESRDPGAFRLSYLLEQTELSASLLAYPDPKTGGGYFLLLAAPPAPASRSGEARSVKRELTLVVDRSGSMQGRKIEQVRETAKTIIGALAVGETFNLLVYNDSVERFSPQAVVKDEANMRAAVKFLDQISAMGGTNIHDAMVEALRPAPREGTLPIVLFLTDGLATVGQTSEKAIRDAVSQGNTYQRRIFTFGVGTDVNAPLLDRIAADTRGTSMFVLPQEDIEVKVGQVFRKLTGPVLAGTTLDAGTDGKSARIVDVLPGKLPDLYENDQLVVLGRYIGDGPVNFTLTGQYLGHARKFRFSFPLETASTRNGFVPRLWASRKIAAMVESIRQAGAEGPAAAANPKTKELVDEIVRLSTEFGILTEYTAFLAREGTRLDRPEMLVTQANSNLMNRAVMIRDGMGAANQSVNLATMQQQGAQNMRNSFVDEHMNRVEINAVQQVADRAFFNRGGRWVDSRLVQNESQTRPARVIAFGSPEFRELADRLAREGRQGSIAMRGDILLMVGNEAVLVRGPEGAGKR